MRSTLNHNKISLEVKTRPPYDHSINWPVHDPPFRPSSLEHQIVSIDMAQDLVAVRNLVSKVNALGGMFLLVQFMHRFAFILIFFRQYLHFTVCLMIGSSATSSAMLAIAYKAKPTPRKLMILLRKLLTKLSISASSSSLLIRPQGSTRLTHKPSQQLHPPKPDPRYCIHGHECRCGSSCRPSTRRTSHPCSGL
jgi:hypothetical protein